MHNYEGNVFPCYIYSKRKPIVPLPIGYKSIAAEIAYAEFFVELGSGIFHFRYCMHMRCVVLAPSGVCGPPGGVHPGTQTGVAFFVRDLDSQCELLNSSPKQRKRSKSC